MPGWHADYENVNPGGLIVKSSQVVEAVDVRVFVFALPSVGGFARLIAANYRFSGHLAATLATDIPVFILCCGD
jgi:hypothetical protein